MRKSYIIDGYKRLLGAQYIYTDYRYIDAYTVLSTYKVLYSIQRNKQTKCKNGVEIELKTKAVKRKWKMGASDLV